MKALTLTCMLAHDHDRLQLDLPANTGFILSQGEGCLSTSDSCAGVCGHSRRGWAASGAPVRALPGHQVSSCLQSCQARAYY